MDVSFFYFLLLFLSFIISLLSSLYLVSYFIKRVSKTKFIGTDMNKISKPKVCELGGIPVFLSFLLSLLFVFLLNHFLFLIIGIYLLDFITFTLVLITVFLTFFMGFVDDILGWKSGITQLQHFLLPILFSIPMIIFSLIYEVVNIYIPFIGYLYVGLIYSLIFVPVAITATTNSFNLFAGFNGLEAGLGIIIFLTISILSLLEGNFTLLLILFAWIGALLGFLKYNKYPSKIFPGDIITLINGVFAGISAIVLRLEILIAFLIIIFIIEFFIKFKHNFKTECFGIITKKGYLKPNPKKGSLTHIILSFRKFTEKSFVFTVYTIQGVISGLTILFYFLI